MSRIEELRAEIVQLGNAADHLKSRALIESRDLSEEELREFRGTFGRFEAARHELEQLEERHPDDVAGQIAALDRMGSTSAGRLTTPEGPDEGSAYHHQSGGGYHAVQRRDGGWTATQSGRRTMAAPTARYADVHGSRGNLAGWGSVGEFLNTIGTGLATDRLIRAAATGLVGEDGGFDVPSIFIANMLDASLENEIVRPRARNYAMINRDAVMPRIDYQDNSGAIGGLVGEWLGEGQPASDQKARWRMVQMQARKLAIFASASNELVADGLDFEAQLTEAMTNSLGFSLDDAFLNGSGVGKPLGVLNSDALISVAKESSQPADTIVYPNVVNMFARLHPASVRNSVWVVNPTTLTQLLQMKFLIPNVAGSENVGGAQVAVLADSGGQMTLLTRPVLLSEKLPVLGNRGDILLADFRFYMIGLRRDAVLQRSQSPGWQSDVSDWRLITRVAGRPSLDGPITPRNGVPLSAFITLDERS